MSSRIIPVALAVSSRVGRDSSGASPAGTPVVQDDHGARPEERANPLGDLIRIELPVARHDRAADVREAELRDDRKQVAARPEERRAPVHRLHSRGFANRRLSRSISSRITASSSVARSPGWVNV
jgi:hypothetical protein